MKTQSHETEGKAEAIVNKAVKNHGKADLPKGATAKRQSNRDKGLAKAGASTGEPFDASKLESEGKRDAKTVLTIDQAGDGERCKLFARIGQEFGPLGHAEKKGEQKKLKFAPATEAYFQGWKTFRESKEVADALKASITVRMAECRRVVNAYIVKGREYMDGVMFGPGSYHQKINALPTMTDRPPKQPKGKGGEKGEGTKGPGMVDLSKETDAEKRREIIAHYSSREITEIVGNLPENQLWHIARVLLARLKLSKNKEFGPLIEGMDKGINAADISDAKDKAGEQEAVVDNAKAA